MVLQQLGVNRDVATSFLNASGETVYLGVVSCGHGQWLWSLNRGPDMNCIVTTKTKNTWTPITSNYC